MLDKEILLDTLRDKHSEDIIEIIDCCQFSGKNYLDVAENLPDVELIKS